jgi:NADH-quinone oxidoreductase subunit L
VIDDGLVNGSAKLVGRVAALVRRAQTGFLYHYAFAMIVGLLVLLGGFVWYANR